jgi:hypothetical protein
MFTCASDRWLAGFLLRSGQFWLEDQWGEKKRIDPTPSTSGKGESKVCQKKFIGLARLWFARSSIYERDAKQLSSGCKKRSALSALAEKIVNVAEACSK